MKILINGKARTFDTINGTDSLTANFTVASLVQRLDLAGKRLAIERNGEIVPRSQFEHTLLLDGDRLEIVGAVGGG